MKTLDLWKLSLRNVLASPVRSLLTVLGIAIGAGAILAVLTLGEAGRIQVHSEMGRLGIDRVWITAGEERLMREDAVLIAKRMNLQMGEAAYLPVEMGFRDQVEETVIIGCTPEYLTLTGVEVQEGRAIFPAEWSYGSPIALAGTKLAEKLRLLPGAEVTAAGKVLTICGILGETESFSRMDLSDALIMPLSAVGLPTEEVHEMVLNVPVGSEPDQTAAMARHVMETALDKTAECLTMQVQMEAADSVVTTFVDVLGWVAMICMLVGGIGVMNILLVSVRERRREIGVMKSLGSSHRQICALFLMEAVSYALIGGVLGILTGGLLVAVAGGAIGLKAWVKAGDCILVFLAALGIGLFFGVVPAYRAARMSCVDALRGE